MKMAMLWIRHPTYETLSRFSDGTLDRRGRRQVGRHLEKCGRCRREVQVALDTDRAIRRIPVPAMPPDLLDRALARRASSITPLIPKGPPGERRHRGRLVGAGVVMSLILGLGWFLFVTRSVAGDASILEIGDLSVVDPRGVELRFLPPAGWRSADSVRVRAWSWDGRNVLVDAPPTLTTTTLGKAGDRFRGWLPVDAVDGFTWLAVEDVDADHLAANGGAFWTIPSHSANRRSISGYVAEFRAYQALADQGLPVWGVLTSIVADASRAYPEDPGLSYMIAAYELRMAVNQRTRDSVIAIHDRRLARFAENPSWGPEQLAALAQYAATLGQHSARDRWMALLQISDPDHPTLGTQRVTDALTEFAGHPDALRSAFEREWRLSGPANRMLIQNAFEILSGHDLGTPTLQTWAARQYDWAPDSRDRLLTLAAAVPATRPWAIERLPDQIRTREEAFDFERPVHQTRLEFEAVAVRRTARLRAALGMALIAEGDRRGGARQLLAALQQRWDPEEAAAFVDVMGRDDPDVAWVRSLLAADPFADPDLGSMSSEAGRAELLSRLQTRVATGRIPSGGLRFETAGGSFRIDESSTLVVALLHSVPRTASPDARALQEASVRLRHDDIDIVLVGDPSSVDDLSTIAAQTGARTLTELNASATRAFGGWHARSYAVVHDGRYWMHYNAHDAARLAILLVGT